MKDIFLSYASRDREQATIFVEALEKEGWTIWWDQTLLAGQDYESKITEELKESKGVIVLLSNNSVNSEWVSAECSYAMDRFKKPLLPVLLETVELPLRLFKLNAINLTNWDGSTENLEFKRLLKSLPALIGKPITVLHSKPKEQREAVKEAPSPVKRELTLPKKHPPTCTTGLSQLIFLPFGIPLTILLLSHLLIRALG